jgi:hypothetical protein
MNISIPIIISLLVVSGVYTLAKIVNVHRIDMLERQLEMVDTQLENCKDYDRMLNLLKLRKKIRKRIDNY